METEERQRTRLETEALIIGYAMSRLDAEYLRLRRLSKWQEAFGEAADALGEPKAIFKNLRDEFDPFHDDPRRGWHQRLLRPNRQRVQDELHGVSDDALKTFFCNTVSLWFRSSRRMSLICGWPRGVLTSASKGDRIGR